MLLQEDDLLADEDLNAMPDRRITLMGQQQELGSPNNV